MAFSIDTFTGDGIETQYTLSYEWLNQSFIQVKVDGVLQTSGVDYTIDNSTKKVTFTVAPLDTLDIEIKRITPNTQAGLVVNFSDGSGLNATDLNNMSLQLLHILQETIDAGVVGAGSTELSEDTSPSLGGDLATLANWIKINNNYGFTDDSVNEWITLNKATSAVNHLDISNAATGNGPEIAAAGDDSAVDLTITPKGVGDLILDGLKWPQSDGTPGQIVTTNGTGQLSWATVSTGGLGNLVEDVTPQLGGTLDAQGFRIEFQDNKGISDSNSNEVIDIGETASAINHLKITNAATTGDVAIDAIGEDAAIGLTITPKGSGDLILDGLKWPQADGSANQILTTDGAAQLSFTSIGGESSASKGWLLVTGGGTPVIADSYNVTSIVDAGVGDLDITWDVDFSSTTYVVVVSTQQSTSISDVSNSVVVTGAGTTKITHNEAAAPVDPATYHIAAFGDQ